MNLNQNQREQGIKALHLLIQAIVETVNEFPNGAPCGPIYAALLTAMPNLSSTTFNQIIESLVAAKKLRREHNQLFPV